MHGADQSRVNRCRSTQRRNPDADRIRILLDERLRIGQRLARVEAFVCNLCRIVPEAHGNAAGVLNIRAENLYGNHLVGRDVERGNALVASGIVKVQSERKTGGLRGWRPRGRQKQKD